MSSWDDLRLQVLPGTGWVARSTAALLVVPSSDPRHEPMLDQLLSLVMTARPGAGRSLARKLAAVVASGEPEDVPDLVLVADLGGQDVAVLVLGEAAVSAQTAAGEVSLSGRDSLTWVDRVLRSPSRIVAGQPDHRSPDASRHADLVEGVVPGGGVLLEPRRAAGNGSREPAGGTAAAGAAAAGSAAAVAIAEAASVDEDGEVNPSAGVADPPPAPPSPGLDVQARTDVLAAGAPADWPDDDVATEALSLPAPATADAPTEAATEAAATGFEAPGSALVDGVYCPRGHFTDPESSVCVVCGTRLPETTTTRKGVRPQLGSLVLDDGTTFRLDQDGVLGRQPDVDEEVKSGRVRGLRLSDPSGTVSRAHAIVRIVGWKVTLADRRSQNGTYVAAGDSEEFEEVSPDRPVPLAPGNRVQLGERTLVYER
jgi:hypothetical protein